jgi:hypothetical protein
MEEEKTVVVFDWKVQAIKRRIENAALRKRIKELIISRDGWRKRATAAMNENVELVAKLNAIKAVRKMISQINDL